MFEEHDYKKIPFKFEKRLCLAITLDYLDSKASTAVFTQKSF